MSEFLSAYCTLVSSPVQLAQCRQAESLGHLLGMIKHWWHIPDWDDGRLLNELSLLNQITLEDNRVSLAGHWLPYRYVAKSRSVYWCLPDGTATEPFQEESISRYRGKILLNALIQPKTSLEALTYQAANIEKSEPAGFIFHLSRCGSTLVSGCLSELDSTCVLSESPLLTALLLDPALDENARRHYLRRAIDLQACVFPDRSHVVIKWNAWDIFRWSDIHSIYADVPCIFLARNPVEILASHYRSIGHHMSGDLAMQYLHPIFANHQEGSVLDFRIGVLQGLMMQMLSIDDDENIRRLDYRQLDADKMLEIADFFRIPVNTSESGKIKTRLGFHSKTPGQHFRQDSADKLGFFDENDLAHIRQILAPLYQQLST